MYHGGVGEAAFGRFLGRLLPEKPEEEVWINAGFCAGLREELRVGDVIHERYSEGNGGFTRFLCVGRVLATGDEKGEVAEQHPEAWGADMESGVFGRFCREHGVEGWEVRAVSDAVGDDLPLPAEVLYDVARQRERPLALGGYLLGHPGQVPAFARFVAGLGLARRNLADTLIGMIDDGVFFQSRGLTN